MPADKCTQLIPMSKSKYPIHSFCPCVLKYFYSYGSEKILKHYPVIAIMIRAKCPKFYIALLA